MLKTDFKDYVASGDPKYRITANPDGTSAIEDVTTYSQTGDRIGAASLNATNAQVNQNTADIEQLNSNLAQKIITLESALISESIAKQKYVELSIPAGYKPISSYLEFSANDGYFLASNPQLYAIANTWMARIFSATGATAQFTGYYVTVCCKF